MELPSGEVRCVLGANGAGKSTLLKTISGLLKLEGGNMSGGSIEFEGRRIDGLDIEEIVECGIFHIVEGGRVFKHLTVEENLLTGAMVCKHAHTGHDLNRVYEYFPRLSQLRKNTAGYTSGGEQQMVVIGRALMAHPRVLLLDEPSLGLSPLVVGEIFQILHRINREEGTSVLLVEQNAAMALKIAQYGYVLETGSLVLDGPSHELRENEDVKAYYLGLSELGSKMSYNKLKRDDRQKE
jgi:branched-chain amino acid transport system ATP-binding protein